MSLIPTWPIAAGALAAGVIIGGGADHLYMDAKLSREEAKYSKLVTEQTEQERQRQAQRSLDERAAREKEQKRVADAARTQEKLQNAYNDISSRLAAATQRLQNRPDRQPASTGGMPQAAPACTGATGAQLSRTDGQFLSWESARADTLRAALDKCYADYAAGEVTTNTPTPQP